MKLSKKSMICLVGLVLVVVALVIYFFGYRQDSVNSYEECDKQYQQNSELYTGKCTTPDGRMFTSPNP
jgi:hypothetical protein